jgi:hypothetical protein
MPTQIPTVISPGADPLKPATVDTLRAPKASPRIKRRLLADVDRVTFVIRAENHPDALARVVMLFHRLNIDIDALYMARRREWRSLLMTLTTHGNTELARRLEANLYKVVSVRSVKIERGAQDRVNGKSGERPLFHR